MPRYESITSLQRFAKCGELWRLQNDPDIQPAFRYPALIIGSAVHEVVRLLHQNPSLSIPALVEQEVEVQEMYTRVPVKWGKARFTREGRMESAIRAVEGYWRENSNVHVLRQEAWFYFDLYGQPIRGKLDMLIKDYKKRLAIWELKYAANEPTQYDLERSIQFATEYYAIKHGVLTLDDNLPYVGLNSTNYHVHDWIESETEPGIYYCKHCRIKAQKLDTYPAYVQYVDIEAYDPGKTKHKQGDLSPRRPQPLPLTFTQKEMTTLEKRLLNILRAMKAAKDSGEYPCSLAFGYNSPCKDCAYAEHCEQTVCRIGGVNDG